MKKTLIAASIAALAATSANAAVKLYESETGSFSSYGKVQLELQNYDGENNIQNQGSRLGFSGETKLDNGLTAFTNFEFRFQPGVQNNVSKSTASGKLDASAAPAAGDTVDVDVEGEGEWTVRNSYLGVKGDFGSVKAGNFDSITYSMVTSQADIMENVGYRSLDTGNVNSRGTAIAYETNDISGFKFGLGIKHYASEDTDYDAKGTGSILGSKDGKEQWNLQLGATYQLNDEVKFGLAIDQNNKKGNPKHSYDTNDADPIIAVSALYETEQFGAGLVVEQTKDIIVTNLTGSYNYGAGDVYALVSFADVGDKSVKGFGGKDDSGVDFGLGVNYKLAKTFHVYGEVAVGNKKVSEIQKTDGSGKGATAVTVGAAYKW